MNFDYLNECYPYCQVTGFTHQKEKKRYSKFSFWKCTNLEADANSHPDGKLASECSNTFLLISSTRGQFEDAVTVIY